MLVERQAIKYAGLSESAEVDTMHLQMSRAQPKAAYVEKTSHKLRAREDWYDQHPVASFGQNLATGNAPARGGKILCE